MSKAHELALKLKALADRGATPGERGNAQDLLQKHLDKHGITLQDLESEVIKTYYYVLKSPKSLRFFNQMVASVVGDERKKTELTAYGKRQKGFKVNENVVMYEVTSAEMVEIVERFKFYWQLYLSEEELFYNAFIQKNELYINDARWHKRGKSAEPDPEELKRLMKMMDGIKQDRPNKKLEAAT